MNRSILLLLSLLIFLFSGCGPIQSTLEINQATVEIQSAYRVGAHKTAPYHYYKAKAYLYKAKDERAYSDFQEAKDLAEKARKLAAEAKAIASEDKSYLLEEGDLKLEKDATANVDASENIEIKNIADQKKDAATKETNTEVGEDDDLD
ncbi:DUF4398 domain-containing protein [bacterium]|nr:DUF4398 domain-containing protein [bacterium]